MSLKFPQLRSGRTKDPVQAAWFSMPLPGTTHVSKFPYFPQLPPEQERMSDS